MKTTKTPNKKRGIVLNVDGRAYIAIPVDELAVLLDAAAAKNHAGSSFRIHWQKRLEKLDRYNQETTKKLDAELAILWEQLRQLELDMSYTDDAMDAAVADEVNARLALGEEEHIPAVVARRLVAADKTPIRIWREYRGLNQAELARRSGVSQPMISNMDRGNNIGSAETLRKVADVLNVTVDDLLS